MNYSLAAQRAVPTLSAEDEDRRLAAQFARGEPGALEAVISLHQRHVTTLAARLLGWRDGAEDIAQDVFLAAWRSRQSFRGDAQLGTYLTRITINCCRSRQRRQWLEAKVRGLLRPLRPNQVPAADHDALRDESALAVRRAIAALPTAAREVIVLRYLEELPIAAMAELLGVERNTVEARLSRARKLLAGPLADFVQGE